MSLLLDTHVWLWWTSGEERRFPQRVRRRIADPGERVAVSIASLWELAIKASLGRLSVPRSPASYALDQLKRQRFDLLELKVKHLDAVAALPPHHRDPFDRLLIAQAQVEPLTIVTADRAFRAYDVAKIVF
ncbi:MAG: type II toxin-antitoxin system VapC family toxin [Vulcanimicrobiaceae bacterium]